MWRSIDDSSATPQGARQVIRERGQPTAGPSANLQGCFWRIHCEAEESGGGSVTLNRDSMVGVALLDGVPITIPNAGPLSLQITPEIAAGFAWASRRAPASDGAPPNVTLTGYRVRVGSRGGRKYTSAFSGPRVCRSRVRWLPTCRFAKPLPSLGTPLYGIGRGR